MAKKINISLPDDVYERATEKAKELGLSRSSFISFCISDKMNQDEAVRSLPKLLQLAEQQINENREQSGSIEQH